MGVYEDLIASAAAHWPLQDNAANAVIAALKGANATLVGGDDTADLSVSDGPPGYSRSLDLDGSNDYVQTTLRVSDLPANCAVLVWYKSVPQIDQTVQDNQLVGNSEASFFFEVGHTTPGFRGAAGVRRANNSFPPSGGPYTINTTAWGLHGIAIDAGSLYTVVNGQRQTFGIDVSDGFRAPTQPIRFGINTSRPALGKIAGAIVVPSATQATLTALSNGPLPAHVSGTLTLSADLETITDNTTFAASVPNGEIIKTESLQERIAGQWQETHNNTFDTKVEGREYRVEISAANNGGNDPSENQYSPVVTYTAAVPRVARRAPSPIRFPGFNELVSTA